MLEEVEVHDSRRVLVAKGMTFEEVMPFCRFTARTEWPHPCIRQAHFVRFPTNEMCLTNAWTHPTDEEEHSHFFFKLVCTD